jgi:F1F0 ATPase subunit 2
VNPAVVRSVIFGALAGLLIGAVHFYGLWLTVRRVPTTRHPKTLVGVSFVVRLLILGSAFALVGMVWGPLGLLSALITLLIARIAVIRVKMRPVENKTEST